MRTAFAVLALCCATSPLVAQNRAIFPSNMTSTEGSVAQSGLPFSGGVTRTQMLYESYDITVPNGQKIKSVGFRQDGNAAALTGYQLQLEILMGPTTVAATTSSGTFANNITTPLTTVYTKKVYALPSLPAAPGGGPSTNFVTIPLDVPLTYDASKNLLVEYRVYANSNGSQPFYYPLDQTNGESPTSVIHGTGCPTSGGKTPALTASGGLLGQYWGLSLYDGPGSQLVGLMISAGQTSFGLPGAPGCSLYVDLNGVVTIPLTTTSGGGASFSALVPNTLTINGRSLFAQIAVIDIFANALGVVTSNGVQTTLVSPPRAALIVGNNVTATTGANYQLVSLVSTFGY